jgi:hypothetical protein
MLPVRADLLLAEDERVAAGPDRHANKPLRFAEVLEVDLGLTNSGAWEEIGGGDRVWRLRIHSPGAKSLALVFRRYHLPEGGELYVYDDRREIVRGAYTDLENPMSGEFAVRPLRGDALTLEYYEPNRARGTGELALSLVAHDYRGVLELLDPADRSGGGGQGNCEVDVNCALGNPWTDQINACVKVVSISGGAFCSGSLLNNTANDGSLLVLTAAHCGGLMSAVFTFNYERSGCRTGGAPTTNTITGAEPLIVATNRDVQLARLRVPQGSPGFPVYLAGWDRTNVPPASTVLIHHPGGVEKKISHDDDPPTQASAFWRILNWERGVTEGGSSGAPLFDPAGRFIGNLDSGSSVCPVPNNDFCTRIASAWPYLAPYLDPLGTGQMTLDGLDLAQVTPQPFTVTSILPAQIDTLDPDPARTLRIIGSGFSESAEVMLSGIPLQPFYWSHSGYSFLNVSMPPLPVGQYMLGVRDNGVTMVQPLTVVGVTKPVLQVGFGTPEEPVWSTYGVDTYHADVPGHVHYCFWSLSNLPSVHPLLTLGIGNNWTDYRYCEITPIPARGYVKVHHPIRFQRLPFGTRVYNQAACISHGVPFGVSNIQSTIFQF